MSKRLVGIALILLLPVASAGTDKQKKTYELLYQDVQRLRQQLLQMKEKIDGNAEELAFVRGQLRELLEVAKNLQAEQASLKEEQRRLPGQTQILLQKLETMSTQLIKLSEEFIELKRASLPPGGLPAEPAADSQPKLPPEKKPVQKKEEKTEEEAVTSPTALLSPPEVFNMAYSDYRNGNFELAIDGFQMYKEQFPDSPLVDDSLYWIGECYFSQKKFEEAIEQFNELILNYPRGDKVPAAYLKKGICLLELGKKEEALAVFTILVSKFPLEEETKIAQQKIKEIRLDNARYQQPE